MNLSAHDHDGDGPPILLLHGAGGSSETWETLAPQLNSRAVAVDLRGHGESDGAQQDATLAGHSAHGD